MLFHRIVAVLIALIGVFVLRHAMVQLPYATDTGDKKANAALKANGGYMQADEMSSYRQIGANEHLAKCGLTGLAGITLMGVGVLKAMSPPRMK